MTTSPTLQVVALKTPVPATLFLGLIHKDLPILQPKSNGAMPTEMTCLLTASDGAAQWVLTWHLIST